MIVPIRLRQICILHRNAELIKPRASNAKCSILPDNVPTVVHEQDAIVEATIRGRAQWFSTARRPSACHKSKSAYSFGIVGTHNGVGRNIVGAVSKMPHNLPGRGNLDDAVVELISDKNIARMIEVISGLCDPGISEDKTRGDEK